MDRSCIKIRWKADKLVFVWDIGKLDRLLAFIHDSMRKFCCKEVVLFFKPYSVEEFLNQFSSSGTKACLVVFISLSSKIQRKLLSMGLQPFGHIWKWWLLWFPLRQTCALLFLCRGHPSIQFLMRYAVFVRSYIFCSARVFANTVARLLCHAMFVRHLVVEHRMFKLMESFQWVYGKRGLGLGYSCLIGVTLMLCLIE